MNKIIESNPLSAYLAFNREQWCRYRKDAPLTLDENDLERLHGQNEVVSLKEVEEIYLPLSRLLSFYVSATQTLHQATSKFLGAPEPKVPYIIGVAGSVAVGKSTTSRILQALLSRWPNHPKVALVTTDGFLYSMEELKKREIVNRKGFPESYDIQKLLTFLQDIKSGKNNVKAPIYSHHLYDIVPDEFIIINKPDIVIVEGLNILQTGAQKPGRQPQIFVSDFFDFTIFVDAPIEVIKKWYVDRVIAFVEGPFTKSDAYFHYLTKMNKEELEKFAEKVWHEINELNLFENILPFKNRAHLILKKSADHAVEKVYLRKL